MKKLVVALALLASFVASAQNNRIVSIDAFDLAYTGGLAFRRADTKNGSDRKENTFRFNLNYAQNIEQYIGLMWKAKAYYNRTDIDQGSYDELTSAFGVAGGLIYNFDADDIKNSILVGGTVGLERATFEENGMDDKSAFNWTFEVEAGKRWDLGRYSVANITYAPTVSLGYTRYGGDIRKKYYKSESEVKFNFLKFDIIF